MTQMELEARSQIAMQEIERRLSEYDALTQERDELREAASDALAGWRYIRSRFGDLAGVGWDRVEDKLAKALATKKEM